MWRACDDAINAAIEALLLASMEAEALEHEDAERLERQLALVRMAQELSPRK